MDSKRRLDESGSRRSERRRFIRDHHPDRGGDPGEFIAGLRQRAATTADKERPSVVGYRKPLGLRRIVLVTKNLIHRKSRPSTSRPRVR